jgi:hypothetical protein
VKRKVVILQADLRLQGFDTFFGPELLTNGKNKKKYTITYFFSGVTLKKRDFCKKNVYSISEKKRSYYMKTINIALIVQTNI